jgi:hypothetical protein
VWWEGCRVGDRRGVRGREETSGAGGLLVEKVLSL